MTECSFCHRESVRGGLMTQFCEDHHRFMADTMTYWEHRGKSWQEAEKIGFKLLIVSAEKEVNKEIIESIGGP